MGGESVSISLKNGARGHDLGNPARVHRTCNAVVHTEAGKVSILLDTLAPPVTAVLIPATIVEAVDNTVVADAAGIAAAGDHLQTARQPAEFLLIRVPQGDRMRRISAKSRRKSGVAVEEKVTPTTVASDTAPPNARVDAIGVTLAGMTTTSSGNSEGASPPHSSCS